MKNEEYFEKRFVDIKGADEDEWVWQKIDGSEGSPDGGSWEGPQTDWNENHYEKFMRHTPRRVCVVTAGGNHGMYVRPYSDMFDIVYTFEPDWLNFHCLVRNTLRSNVFAFRAALGAKPSMAAMIPSSDKYNTGMHRVTPHPDGGIVMMTVDQLNLSYLDLLQLDVEGFEHQILLGAEETIKKYHPTIIVEGLTQNLLSYIKEDLGYEPVDSSIRDVIFV